MSGIVAIIIIAALFIGIAAAVYVGAARGSFHAVGQALQTTNRSSSRLLNTVLVVVYLVTNLAVDLLYAALDPRIRYG